MSLRDEILAKVSPDVLKHRDVGEIAAAVSEGRTRYDSKFVGKAEVIHALGILEGAVFLYRLKVAASMPLPDPHTDTDVVNKAMTEQAWSLVDNKELDVGTPQARIAVDMFVGPLLTKEQGDKIKALAEVPDPVSELDVRREAWSDTGEWTL